jgi:predicted Zn-dependent peptidase
MADNANTVEKQVFPNGLVVITEAMPHVRSVSMGVWLRNGSRREPPELNGISHFIEHMVFKGTERRTTEQIARETDRIGGMLDAFTAREMVCFNTRVLDEHLGQGFDLLSDLVLRPLFAEEEILREKSVILEEIKMTQDNPEDLVHELFTQNFWSGHSLGRPILGTPETVGRFNREMLYARFRQCYSPNHMVITAAGNITHREVVDLVAKDFADLKPAEDGLGDTPPAPAAHITLKTKRDLEQVHICLGVPAFSLCDPRRFTASVLNTVLGSGMSSRLFQNIREKQGLAYAVFSEMNPYRDVGVLSVYGGTMLDSALQLVRSVIAEFRSLTAEPVTEEELRRAKDHIKGAMLLSLESSSARMSSLARHHLYFGRYFSPDELIRLLEGVTREEMQQVAQEFFQPERIAAAALGNLNGFALTPTHLSF